MDIDKYLNEGNGPVTKDNSYYELVSKVASKTSWTAEGAAEFIYDLLDDINFRKEGIKVYNFLMKLIK